MGRHYNSAMTNDVAIDSAEFARAAIDVASELQASEVVMLDITKATDFADYFVVLTAESPRQMESLAEEIERALKGAGASLHHREGTHQTGWMLLDFGDLIVHIFAPEERGFYHIEGVWSDSFEVVRIQ